MASTRKINDPCYFNILCNDSKFAGNYNLNTVSSINPKKCLGCSKFKLCSVLENVVDNGTYTKDYQVNFI